MVEALATVIDMDFAGLPLHPLVVHAAVGLVPLAVLSSWVFAVVPGWRWLSRWFALVSSLMALAAVVLARVSGKALLADRPFLTSPDFGARDLLRTHQERASVLLGAVITLTVLVGLAFWLLPAPTELASGRLDHRGSDRRLVRLGLPVLLVAAGMVALVWVVLTGDAGSRAVWGQQ